MDAGAQNGILKNDATQEKGETARLSSFIGAMAIADLVKTTLGPKGMDKMIKDDKENVTITNDGATILQRMKVLHPAARMLVELSKVRNFQNIEHMF